MDSALLIPVKDLSKTKSRLGTLLSREERRELAWLMLTGVMQAAAGVDLPLRKVIVTSYGPARELAAEMGFDVLGETRQTSESASVDFASMELEQGGVGAVLRVPLDLPLLRSEHLEHIFELAHGGLGAVLVPSYDGTGTNALYRSPPTLFASQFGPNSLALHRQDAQRLGVKFRVEEIASLALDIDTPEDLRVFMKMGREGPVRDYLLQIGILERLAGARAKGKGGA